MSRKTWIALLVALLVPAVPAGAANHAVVASDDVFTPADVTIVQGDSVTWNNGGGTANPHNVHFDDNSFDVPAVPDTAAWTVSRSFDNVGVFRYYCEAHGGPMGVGMSGAVYVNAAPAPPPAQSGQPVSADKTAPTLMLSGSTRQKVLRQRSVFVLARVDEPSRVVARALISVPGTGKKLRAKSVSKQLAARTTTRFGMTFSTPTVRTFRRALRRHTGLTARITVTAKDPSGNQTSAKRRVKLRK